LTICVGTDASSAVAAEKATRRDTHIKDFARRPEPRATSFSLPGFRRTNNG
jgi:hypothetical protein